MAESVPSQQQGSLHELRPGLTRKREPAIRGSVPQLGVLSKALPSGTPMKDIIEFLRTYKGPLITRGDIYRAASEFTHKNDQSKPPKE
jgi:hypothetical protein